MGMKAGMESGNVLQVRTVLPNDMKALLRLIAEHCTYEGTSFVDSGQSIRLQQAFFGLVPRLFGALALINDTPVGFITFSLEYSTWDARDYMHMDCLYLEPDARGHGLGMRLIDFAKACAVEQGCDLIQWQTPADNEIGKQFYSKLGASSKAKLRYYLRTKALN
jgi:GNAT superfamily N-acetyltransferase